MIRRFYNSRYDWPVYGGPASNIQSSVDIGMRHMVTRHAPKLVLGFAVLFGYMAAGGALAAGVTRINSDQQDACESGLVLQEQAQLRECPGMQYCSLLAPSRNPLANAGQFLDRQSTPGAFSLRNDLLGNIVVDTGGKVTLLAGEPFQFALRRTCLQLLNFRPQPPMTEADAFDFGTGVLLTVRRSSDIGNSQVNPEKIGRFNRRTFRQIDSAVQVEFSASIDQVSLSLNAVEPLFLVLAIDKRDYNATFWHRPQAHAVDTLESHDALIISNRAIWPENRADIFIAPKTLHGFSNGTDSHLSGQVKTFSDFSIRQSVDRRLTEYSGIESSAGGESRGLVYALHGLKQPFSLFGVGQELQLECQLHCLGVYHSFIRGSNLGYQGKKHEA